MHLLYLPNVCSFVKDIVVELVSMGDSSQFRSRELAERMKPYTVDATQEYIPQPKWHKQRCDERHVNLRYWGCQEDV